MLDSSTTTTREALQTREPATVPSAPGPEPEFDKTAPAPAGRQKLWLWIGALLVFAVGGYFVWLKIASANAAAAAAKAAAAGPPPIPVVTATSRKGDIGVYYSGLGAVTPLATVTVRTRVDGQLMNVRYREGDTVQKGVLLAEIDDGPYQAALTQAEGQLMRDQASLENARIDLVRYQQLVAQKAGPEQQLATQQATVHQDEGVVKLDEGQIQSAKVNLAYCKIVAPIAGRIGLRLVDAGNIVQAADTTGLLIITQMDPISAIFTISEDQLQAVVQKMAAGQKLEVDAYDRAATTKLAQGSLTTLDNQVDPTTGTLKLRATFQNPKGTLYPNQFVNAKLLVQEKRGVTLVPTAAVQRNSQATYVYVVNADSTVAVRPIVLGTTEGNDSEVTSGLAPAEVVVMTGVDKLQAGSKVSTQLTPPKPVSAAISPAKKSAKAK
jgi:multidrug efflux system membrane fusion protein